MTDTIASVVKVILDSERKSGHEMSAERAVLLNENYFMKKIRNSKNILVTGEPGPWNSFIIR